MKYIVTFLLLIPSFFHAQVLENYPEGQNFYDGGIVNLYKDLQTVLVEKGYTPCENKKEIYTVKILVDNDKTIKLVKDSDSLNIENNKCAYETVRSALKYLNKWKPAEINGKSHSALASFTFYPNAFFGNYKKGYDILNHATPAEYPGGINSFREQFYKNVNLRSFNFNGEVKTVLKFIINREGVIEDISLEQSSGNADYDDMLIRSVKMIKKNWKPAKMHGQPVKFNFRLPIKVSDI